MQLDQIWLGFGKGQGQRCWLRWQKFLNNYLNDKKISWDMLIQQHLLLMHNCGKCNYLINPASPQNKAFIRKRLHIAKKATWVIISSVSCFLRLQLGYCTRRKAIMLYLNYNVSFIHKISDFLIVKY